MDKCQISIRAKSTGPDLHLRVSLDNQILFNSVVDNEQVITGTFDCIDNTMHTLDIEMSKKLPEHTVLSEDGKIISDRLIEIAEITIDDVDITKLFYEYSTYTHDYNGTGSQITQKFYRYMGCNGLVKLEFPGPVYKWMLESMQ